MDTHRRRLRQAALLLFGLAAAWTLIVAVSGGFFLRLGTTRISSRSPLNPGIAALAAAIAAWALATRDERRRAIAYVIEGRGLRRLVLEPPHHLATGIVVTAVVSVVAFGLLKGSFVAGGSDAYGYVSQADLWARGDLIVRQPFAREMTWPNAAATLAPLGYRPYRPAPHGTDIVPAYSPGVPMLMGVFKIIAGAKAVYWVVPLLGGLAVWTTFVMGKRLAGPLVGASAAVLLASSPPFLFESIAPASDVAATAWWAVAFTCLLSAGPSAAFGAGLATGLAITTRPNLVPLALVPGALLVWRALRARWAVNRSDNDAAASGSTAVGAIKDVACFVAGAVPACIVVAAINWRLYGSPVTSGYGTLSERYDWSYLWPNLARYPRWLLETQTPLVLLAVIAPFVLPARAPGAHAEHRPRAAAIAWLAAIAAIFPVYLFYVPFDEWWYLRFILPVYPLIFVLMSAALAGLFLRSTRVAPGIGRCVVVVVVSWLAWHGVTYATDRGVTDAWRGDQRYVETGAWIADHLPERAALLSMQHSGAARYYSGRLTIRYDLIAPTDLDLVVEELRRLGYRPYFVLDDWEEPIVRERFQAHSVWGRLDWIPVALLNSAHVRIYDAADRDASPLSRDRAFRTVP